MQSAEWQSRNCSPPNCHSAGGSLSKGVSVQGCLCPGVSLSRGVSVQGGLCQGNPRMVTRGRYASYWNAFLFHNKLSMNSLNLMTQNLQSKGFGPRISLVKGQCVNLYSLETSATAIIFKLTLVCAIITFIGFVEFSVS